MLVRQPIDVMIFVLSTLHAGKKLGKAVNRTLTCSGYHPSKTPRCIFVGGAGYDYPSFTTYYGYVCWYVVDLDMYLYV